MTGKDAPDVVVLAGPNGSGKSTTGATLLRDTLGITEFVNADTIAQGLSAFDPAGAAIKAGRVMLQRIRELARERADFAFETTLAGRMFASWLAELRSEGYRVHIIFLWLPSDDLAVARVADRVRMGGHDVPEEAVRRRYRVGLRNFFELYQPLANTWRLYDNSKISGPRLVAAGSGVRITQITEKSVWEQVRKEHKSDSQGK